MESLKIVQLFCSGDVVAFKVQDLQVFKHADIEEFVKFIEGNVEFSKLFEYLDALDFFNFAASDVEYLQRLERSADVSETPYN